MEKNDIKNTRDLINTKLAQRYNLNDRFQEEANRNHLGNDFEKYSCRDEFNRDADRIIYSKAFRRLEHKAQVYSNKRGDHYRTRLTHTLEVTQIARSISRNLGLNECLVEAIALGHDIGHTPFGHAGEEVLDAVMRGEDDLGGKLEFKIDYGGFKHNFNCLKILEIVEKREKGMGLNLTWQTLDGILKHTHVIKNGKKWDLTRFVREVSHYEPLIKYDYFDDESEPSYEYPLTLEGQVVAISDEIAQREHDLDDSLRDCDLFRFEDMFEEIKNIVGEICKKYSSKNQGYKLFKSFYKKILDLEEIENHKNWRKLTSIIISYFILDVTENTMKNINEHNNLEEIIITDDKNRKYISKEFVSFSEIGQRVNDDIDEFIKKRIIYSFNVSRFDGKGKFVLRQLFKAYYENPRQMPKKQLFILIKKIKEITAIYPQLKVKIKGFDVNFEELSKVDENNIDFTNLDPMLDILKFKNLDKFGYKLNSEKDFSIFLNSIMEILDFSIDEELKRNYNPEEIVNKFYETLFHFCNIKSVSEIEEITGESKNFLLVSKGWNELHYAYLSTICDYISQMTDDYAIKEYHELYLD